MNELRVRVRRPGERRNVSRSATRALDVLEAFGQARRPLRAVEIARLLGLRPSTADQLLKTLVDSAHLTFDAGAKAYMPSPRFGRFAAWMAETYGEGGALRALVAEIRAATGETVTLTTPNDLFMQVMEAADAESGAQAAERGLRVSIFGSATGTAYLSTLPDAEIVRLATRARLTDAALAPLLAEVAQVRRAGVTDCASGGDSWSVAAPLAAARLPVALVLGLAGPAARVQPERERLRALIRDAASAARD